RCPRALESGASGSAPTRWWTAWTYRPTSVDWLAAAAIRWPSGRAGDIHLLRVRVRRPDSAGHRRRIRAQAFGDFRATLGCAVTLAAIALVSMAIIRRSAT